ncbi:MAG: hypothetical protein CVU94_02885 [Firmicutes bacterium HGW-Firmicutes-19]|nr:MAG: hypothetical protein CVU94_02885 [Firmicutes bacterium HGW-Firmicutes-19]
MQENNDCENLEQRKVTKVGKITTFLCCLYIFLSFYENYVNQFFGFSTRYLILIMIIMLLSNNRKIILKWYHFVLLSWLLLLMLSSFWSRDNTIMNQHFISILGMFGLFVAMTSANFDYKFVNYLIKTMLYTSATMGFLALFQSSSYHNIVETRQVLVLYGIDIDPNNLAALYMIGISIGLYYIISEKKRYIRYFVIVAINTYGVALTGSRGGLVTFIGIVFLFIILASNSISSTRSFIYKTSLLLSVLLSIYFILRILLPLPIYDRLFDFGNYSGGSGRDLLWKNAWNLFKESPVVGAGWGSYYGYNGFYAAVHQTFLSMLCDVGIIGVLLFFIPIFRNITESLRRKNFFPIIILATGLFPALFLDAINKRFFWNAIIISYLILNSNFYDRKESN